MTKRVFRVVSYLLQAGSILFVILKVRENSSELARLSIPAPRLIFPMLGAFVVLVLVSFVLVFAYKNLIDGLSLFSPSWQDVAILHGRTVLAKYLPGNVFQIVGRQVVGKEFGWPQASIAAASVFEIVLLIASSSLLSLLFGLLVPNALAPWLPQRPAILALALGVFGPIAFVLVAGRARLPFLERIGLQASLNMDTAKVFSAGLNYLFFILLGGGMFVFLRIAIFGFLDAEVGAAYLAAFGLSYLIGYITPGAPGGLGVREALLVLLLSAYSPAAIVAASALVHRVSWIAAELAFAYIVVPAIKKRQMKLSS